MISFFFIVCYNESGLYYFEWSVIYEKKYIFNCDFIIIFVYFLQ